MNESYPISVDDVEKVYEELCKVKFADSLINIFKSEVDPTTLKYNLCYSNHEIYSRVKNLDYIAMALRQREEKGIELDFYFGDIQEILNRGGSNSVFCRDFASISAMSKRTGVWAYGKGNEMTYAISVRILEEIILPSKEGRWFFDVMNRLALISGEYFDVSEQPGFWGGDKKHPN